MDARRDRLAPWWLPLALSGVLAALFLGWAYRLYDGQPEAVFHVGNPQQATGYDGQFVYFMARDLNPQRVMPHLDVPAYRYQRILLPLLAHLLGGRTPQGALWAVWGLNFGAYMLGLGFWLLWLREWSVSPWWGLLYGLWPGLLLPLRLGMPEPLAYGLALAGLWAFHRRRWRWAALAFIAALFAKEITLPFSLAAALSLGLAGQPRRAAGWLMGVLAPWLLWQGWLWIVFGRPGVGLGGALAQPPPPVPFGGLAQALLALPTLWRAAYLLVFGPALLLPLAASPPLAGRRLREKPADLWAWLALGHLLLAAALPMMSWDPFAVLRVLTGLLLAFWALALQARRWPWLFRLLPFWGALLAFAVAR